VGQQDSSRFAGEKQMTKEDIMRMAEASGVEDSLLYEHWRCNLESMTRFAALVVSTEREACAKVCEDKAEKYLERALKPKHERDINLNFARTAQLTCFLLADNIRARGQA
jgi:hypothetical protein